MYEPEQFPGLIYRMESPSVVFLIFSAGKIVCVGAKKEEEIYEAVENLRRMLEEWMFSMKKRPKYESMEV